MFPEKAFGREAPAEGPERGPRASSVLGMLRVNTWDEDDDREQKRETSIGWIPTTHQGLC